eukprot:COSAG05_NODE_512_length_9090_cov_33.937827_1_plen_173_part_10
MDKMTASNPLTSRLSLSSDVEVGNDGASTKLGQLDDSYEEGPNLATFDVEHSGRRSSRKEGSPRKVLGEAFSGVGKFAKDRAKGIGNVAGSAAKRQLDQRKAQLNDVALGRLKDLQKFANSNLFHSNAEAERLQAEKELMQREKWLGLLHPETAATAVYNQVHVFFLVYMLCT